MLFHPTERNRKFVPAPDRDPQCAKSSGTLPVHDGQVTMAEPTGPMCTVRTGLGRTLEARGRPETHSSNELRVTSTSKQRLIVAVPTYTRTFLTLNVQVR